MSKVVKISKETYQDLQTIQQFIIDYGTKNIPDEFKPLIRILEDKPSTYKAIIGIAVKFLKELIEKIDEKIAT